MNAKTAVQRSFAGAHATRLLKHLGAIAVAGAVMGGLGCLTRPVTNLTPTTKQNFVANVKQQAVDKIDLLFMIDNSQSMGDKQDLLAQAIPDLITRLLLPQCVLKDDGVTTVPRTAMGVCPDTAKEEFEPVHDMHIGLISSAMGGGGAEDICQADAKIQASEVPQLVKFNRHNDDKAHLINRKKPDLNNPPASGVEDPVQDALPSNFLAWLPDVPKNQGKAQPPVTPLKDPIVNGMPNMLVKDFQEMVRGVQEFGCGLESQMESWYRFLVQPDPWDSIQLDKGQNPAAAQLVGVDQVILQQRRDFLRPDSLVAVIVVSDEEDSWSDPMWLGGRGWITRGQNNTYSTTGQLPRGTKVCEDPIDPNNPTSSGPNDPACQWCAFKGTEADPNCAANKGLYGPKEDGLNVRYTNDMKRRYGMNPQFPVQRYVDGLKSTLVPDRTGEHFDSMGKLTSNYVGRKTCRNPLYAADLPTDPNGELCKLKPGSRTNDLVFFATIGGVPWQLLTEDPKNPMAKFKSTFTETDWQKILGKDPNLLNYEGIDPHMIESIKPRAGIPCGGGAPATCDPFHGREWDTSTSKVGIDLQYACTFTLPQAKDCTKTPNSATCDCGGSYAGPLCDPNPMDSNNLTLQTRGKAYPTIRQFRVVKAMGDNGVIASICPRSLDTNNPDYGYRPAVRAIIDRLKSVLSGQCLPQPLTRDKANGTVPCLILVVLLPGTAADQPMACGPRGQPDSRGLQQPDPDVLKNYNKTRVAELQREAASAGGADAAPVMIDESQLPPVCELTQLVPDPNSCGSSAGQTCTYLMGKPSCENANSPGWCYVEGPAAGTCPLGGAQAIKFGVPPPGQTVIQCIQQTGGSADGG